MGVGEEVVGTRPRRPGRGTVAACLGVTALAVAWEASALPSAVHAPAAHLGVDVVAGSVAAMAAAVFFERALHERRLRETGFACALLLLALSHLLFSAVPVALNDGEPTAYSVQAAIAGHATAGLLILLTILVPDRRVRRRDVRAAAAVTCAVAAGIALAAVGMAPAGRPQDVAEALPSGLHLFGVLAALAGAAAALRRAGPDDDLLRWVALAAVIAGAGRLLFALNPTMYTSHVGPGDAVRLLAHLVLLTGAVQAVRASWGLAASTAVGAERDRMARELHDGVAQDLALILRNTDEDDELYRAAARAHAGVRATISSLRDTGTACFEDRLRVVVAHASALAGVRAGVSVSPGVRPAPDEAEALLAIATEAIHNAARHGGASSVHVRATGGRHTRLVIRDDGRGIPGGSHPGWGLHGMVERAAGVGGTVRLRNRPSSGAEVEVSLR